MKIIPNVRNIVVLRDAGGEHAKNDNGLLRLMVRNEPFGSFILDCLSGAGGFCKARGVIAIPQQWAVPDITNILDVVHYTDTIPVRLKNTGLVRENSWIVVSDGRFFTAVDNRRICEILADTPADVIAVNIVAQLQVSYEKVLTASHNELVGFRLFYENAAQPAPIPDDWPHHLFVRARAMNNLLMEGGLHLTFGKLLELCHSKSLAVRSANAGGSVLDLATEHGLLGLMRMALSPKSRVWRYCAEFSSVNRRGREVSKAGSARLFGPILLGQRVDIGEDAIIVGPAIIGDDVKIGRGAVVRASVIGPGVLAQAGSLIEEKVLTNLPAAPKSPAQRTNGADAGPAWTNDRRNSSRNKFREWPKFSYAMLVKRILDIAAGVIVLILFAPVLPIIMLVIKLTSPGPVFFKDTRQGLHGKEFECLKFRTMKVGADRMQDRLRVLNQADGPQFMMADDPRLSAVGRFLRETYIDEIPQFLNVLFGQMSVVGPRPSPESENRLCPFWRDARLSVRPGITGFWQVCRTRRPMRDFQEWIHYDVKYVRDLSLKLDLWICWQTAKKMVAKFISQF